MANTIATLRSVKTERSFPVIYRKAGKRRLTVKLPGDSLPGEGWWPLMPPRVRPPLWDGSGGWTIPLQHFDATREALLEAYGQVEIRWEDADQRFCTVACQSGNRDRADVCACVCGGDNHGVSQAGLLLVGADLLIDTHRTVRVWTEVASFEKAAA